MKNLLHTTIEGIWVLPSLLISVPVTWLLNRLISLSLITLRGQDNRSQTLRFATLTLLFVLIGAMISFILSFLDKYLGWDQKVDHPLRRLLSGGSLLSKYSSYLLPAVALIIFSVLVANQFHGSSMGVFWHYAANSDRPDPALIFGQVRHARSDEFIVSTPWLLSQTQIGFAETNTLIGGGQKLVLTDSPIKNWEVIFEPQNWSFFALPTEYAFSFRWWFRGLMLLFSSYLFFLQLSGGKWQLASLASISTLFMPIVQWWYSTTFVETAAYFFLLLYLFRRVVLHYSTLSFVVNLVFFCYISLCFVSLIYPPTLIPALIALLFIMAGVLVTKWASDLALLSTSTALGTRIRFVITTKETKLLFVGLFLVLAVDLAFLALFYADNREAFELMRNSSYPGARRMVGGTMTSDHFLGGLFSVLLTKVFSPVPFGPNQCEAATFYPLSVFIFPVLLFGLIKSYFDDKRLDYTLTFLLAAFSLLMVWGFFGLPEFLNKILLLQYSSPGRADLIVGLLNQIIIFYYLEKLTHKNTRDFKIFVGLFSVAVLLFYLHWAKVVAQLPTFSVWLPGWKYWAFIFWMMLLQLLLPLLLLRKKILFWILFATFTIVTTISVNPLYRGLDVILNNDLSRALREVNSSEFENPLWVNYDNMILSNYLAANGLRVLNASQLYPQNNLWSNFDDDGSDYATYNRYSHIVIAQSDSQTETEFILHHGDLFAVKVHPCNPKLDKLGVKYFFFLGETKYSCLEKVKVIDMYNFDFHIYKRKQ